MYEGGELLSLEAVEVRQGAIGVPARHSFALIPRHVGLSVGEFIDRDTAKTPEAVPEVHPENPA